MRLFVCFLVFCLPLGLQADLPATSDSPKLTRVKVIHSYHTDLTWSQDMQAAIVSVFADMPNVQIDTEYLDTKRQSLESFEPQLVELMKVRLKNRPWDVLIVCDNNALDFVQRHRSNLFSQKPIIFCGINGDLPFDEKTRPPNMTGVIESTSPDRTLVLMRQLQPQLRRFYLISDQSRTGQAERQRALALFQKNSIPVECIDLSDLSLQDIKNRISTLNPETEAILLTVFNRDPNGRYYDYEESAEAVSQATEANVYGLWDFYLGHGVIGGHMSSGREQGRLAAEMAKRIIKGESADDIAIMTKTRNRDFVDADLLTGAGLAFADLPIGVTALRHGQAIYVSKPTRLLRMGVLAKAGKPACLKRWQATANHLSATVDGIRVEVVPLSFEEILPAVENNTIDMMLGNPVIYLKSKLLTEMKPMATLIASYNQNQSAEYGGVIFWPRRQGHIKSLSDLTNHKVAAVDPNSFAGYLSQLHTLWTVGAAPPQDIMFSGSHESVVLAVRDGKADVGWVRIGTLERMAARGEIDLRAFHIYRNDEATRTIGVSCSTELYPEWPISCLPHLDYETRRRIGIALLTIHPDDKAAIQGRYTGWTTSHSYKPIRDVLTSLSIPPFGPKRRASLVAMAASYWPWLVASAVGLLLWAVVTIGIVRLNQKLRLANEHSQRSERHLSATLHSIGDAVISTDAQGMVVDLNPVAEALVGMELEQAQGMFVNDVFRIVHGDSRQPVDNPIHTSLNEGKTVELANNTVLIARDGTERQIADSCAPIRNQQEQIIGAVLVFRDVTQEYQQRQLLRESKDRFDEIAELGRHVAWEINAEGLFTYISHVVLDVYGYRREEIIDQIHFFDLYPEEGREAFSEQIFDIMNRRGSFKNLLHPMIAKDGQTIWVETNGAPFYDDDGALIGYRGSDTDFTERIEAKKALDEKENLLTTLIDMLPDLVWLKDTQGVYLVCNQRFEDFFGQPQTNIIGKSDYDFVDVETADAFRTHDHHAMRFRETHINEETITFASDGHEEILETIKKPLIDETGQIIGVLGVGRDITARKTSETQLRKLSQAIEQMAASVVITDTDGTIEYVNPAFTENTGYASLEAIGQNPRILKSGQMRQENYEQMWSQLIRGETWRGELQNRRKDGSLFWELATIAPVKDIDGQTTHYVAVKEEISARKSMEEKLVHEAQTDTLTELTNRNVFNDRLEQLIVLTKNNPDARFAVLFLDIDRFKTINDSLGHDTGDMLLKEVADRLRSCLPQHEQDSIQETTLVSRFGGDEFLVLIEKLDHVQNAICLADEILEALSQPYHLAGYDIYSTASMGIVIADRTIAHSVADILRDADTAMYEAKLAGKGCHRVFDEAMRSRVQTRMNLENDLRKVISNDNLYFNYQPIVDLQTREITNFEALIRWKHPVYGLVSPNEFIPIAEETGLIHEIGEWGLHEACRQLMFWKNEMGDQAPPSISINLSRKQFAMPNLSDLIVNALNEHNMLPEFLHIEVTETAVMEDVDYAARVLNEIKDIGCTVVMDDFGTGHSSLACLHHLPFDVLKIDRTFVSGLERSRDFMAMIHAVCSLAHNLEIAIVAEGIETVEHIALLQSLDCTFGQGYYFSKPMPAHQVADYISRHHLAMTSRDAA